MSNVEAEAESRIIHAARNLNQHLRTRLHHVFHREKQIVRRVGQKLFPEANRLLDVPLREVDIRDKPAVDDDPPHAEPRGQRRRLPEAGHRVGAHVRSMAQGISSANGACSQSKPISSHSASTRENAAASSSIGA